MTVTSGSAWLIVVKGNRLWCKMVKGRVLSRN